MTERECLPPDPTKLGAAIWDARGTSMFSNLDIEARLRADGGELAMAALAEIERLHAELDAMNARMEKFDYMQRSTKAAIAGEKLKVKYEHLKSAVEAHRLTFGVNEGTPLARGWKTALARRLGIQVRTLEKYLSDYPDIRELLQK